MALTPFTGTITAATLRNNFGDATATLATNATAGQKDQDFHFIAVFGSGTALSSRTIAFVAPDDMEVRIFFLRVTDGAGAKIITAVLEQDRANGLIEISETNQFLIPGDSITLTVTSVAGTIDSRTAGDGNFTDTSGTRFRLKKGIRYRVTLANDTAGVVTGEIGLQVRTIRRRS